MSHPFTSIREEAGAKGAAAALPVGGHELLIRKLEQFAPLPEELREGLRGLPFRHHEYSRGQVIATQGAIYEESALVVRGFALRHKVLPDGLRQIVAVQVPGDFSDLHSMVLKPLDHSITAAAPTRIAKVPHAAILELLRAQPDLARWLMWDMAVDAAISREWLACLGRRSAYEHIAHLFCELYFRLGWAGQVENNGFELALNQTELGDTCGLSTVHVNRSLQALRKDGLIVLAGHHLTIPDISALMQASSFDDAYLTGLAGTVGAPAQCG
jgi:CRP-like cAMP-binding protein